MSRSQMPGGESFESDRDDEIVDELTLLLLYLTSWEERVVADLTVRRAWKGYRFEALDALEAAGYLSQSHRAKSVTLTEAGIERARVLAAKYVADSAESRATV